VSALHLATAVSSTRLALSSLRHKMEACLVLRSLKSALATLNLASLSLLVVIPSHQRRCKGQSLLEVILVRSTTTMAPLLQPLRRVFLSGLGSLSELERRSSSPLSSRLLLSLRSVNLVILGATPTITRFIKRKYHYRAQMSDCSSPK